VLRNPRFKEREMARKLVERAKEILMHRRNLKGDEALRWLQKRSMDSRKPLRHIAEAVILSEDIALDRGSGSL
jgi:two-component system, response regulator PdtaR